MKSRSEALNWISQQENKSLTFPGRTGIEKNTTSQCVDLLAYYLQFLGHPWPGANAAKDAWNWDLGGEYRKVNAPVPGAIAVWNGNVGRGFGHVALVYQANADGTFISMDQNYTNFGLVNGGPTIAAKHDMKNVLGFIVPAFVPDPAPVQPPPTPAPSPAAPVAAAPAASGVNVSTERYPQKLSTLWGMAMMYLGDGNRWHEIWNHPNNAALKAKRGEPKFIQPGDVWFVPK